MPRTVHERFWSKISVGPDCWEWTRSLDSGGYGQFKARPGGSSVKAHRFMWEITFGPIPPSLLVCHHCDNRRCVRPEHLFLGTALHNHKDMVRKGRAPVPIAGRKSLAKLTAEKVVEIRSCYAAGGVSTRELAERYGVHKSNIVRAINGTQWADVA